MVSRGYTITQQYLGILGLLARCSVNLTFGDEDPNELRADVERAMRDAEALGLIKWRRVLNRIEVELA